MYFKTEGVVLSRRNFGEADRILSIYTKDFGKVNCLAKGVRRPKSKKAGHLEPASWCKVFIAKGKTLDLLTEVELKRAFGISEFSQEKANKIYHLLELIENLTVEKQKNKDVFVLLVNFLKKTESEDFNLVSIAFKIKLLSTLGFFSPQTLKDSPTKKILITFEEEDFEKIKEKIKLNKKDYLKLLSFLDSMIERLIEAELKTSKFL